MQYTKNSCVQMVCERSCSCSYFYVWAQLIAFLDPEMTYAFVLYLIVLQCHLKVEARFKMYYGFTETHHIKMANCIPIFIT